MPTVSSNTLIRNEIKNIPGLIDNLIKSNVDEIVVLDGGSTDGGLELLQRLAARDKRIKLISWPQPEGSSYRKGFKEVVRRNLMIEASQCEYVFYIDADERVDLDFKSKILPGFDFVATERIHYWDKNIRINTYNDKVWSPETQIRIFRNKKNIRFNSSDANGLHNYLCKSKFKVVLAENKGFFGKMVARLLMGMLKCNIQRESTISIHHFHYYFLHKKENDLRCNEFNRPVSFDLADYVKDNIVLCKRQERLDWVEITSEYEGFYLKESERDADVMH